MIVRTLFPSRRRKAERVAGLVVNVARAGDAVADLAEVARAADDRNVTDARRAIATRRGVPAVPVVVYRPPSEPVRRDVLDYIQEVYL